MNNTARGVLINQFFQIVQELRQVNILRSDRYLGDIGEFIASVIYNVNLSDNQREQTIDGNINGNSVQIKFNASTTKTNINVGHSREYNNLILILSRTSCHFPNGCVSDFVAYNINQATIINTFTQTANNTFSCTKNLLEGIEYREINYEDLH